MKFSHARGPRRGRLIVFVLLIILMLIGGGTYAARRYYFDNLKAVSNSQTTVNVTIPKGSSLTQVAEILKDKQLIRNTWAFQQYVRNKGLQDKILAGTYAMKPSQDVPAIVEIITEGMITSKLVTITPGQRIDQIEQTLVNAGFSPESVKIALDPAQYADHPALVDKPAEASLEGYIFPESFQKTAESTPQQVITAALDEMQRRLTPERRAAFVRQGLSAHEAVVLASIVEREVSAGTDRTQVAQVFLRRLRMPMRLESDATAGYGAILVNQEPTLTFDSDYNTYLYDGLPPGPISNVSEASLQAVAQPATTDWLYFVSGDDGNTYFSKTLQEHEALTRQHCKKLCGN